MTVHNSGQTDAFSPAGELIPFDFNHIVEPFEGPEKTLEIEFISPSPKLRTIPRPVWDDIIKDAGASILEHHSDEHADSYLLSESSLFVFETKIVIKTCGTTTLLAVLPKLTEVCDGMGLTMHWITYSRKNFLFPHDQREPHQNFENETSYLSSHVPLTIAQSLGPEDSDHMFLCTSKIQEHPSTANTCTMTMMMYGLDRLAASQFVKSPAASDGEAMTVRAGIRELFPTALIHGYAFDPCGYSMNALLPEGAYATIHVTPQQSCSYASFETDCTSIGYKDLIARVLDIFKPSRFTISLGVHGEWVNKDSNPVEEKSLSTASLDVFVRECVDQAKPGDDRCFYMANFVRNASGCGQ